ncbi:uncharacterized protein KY384_002590 [Bacidia gigantensis]|uniref:uncharacterized protein n=1 Tax=Bacidia gigantensis TaxID=2732470 RepID=UPI001D037058|nr:uncharacterized protein KY384_002590 [Bacidia gigantensis]KAG8532713.1 hypothetical protein KY384_002590 [Bacidia gigantensis]
MSAYIKTPLAKHLPSLAVQQHPIYLPPGASMNPLAQPNGIPAVAAILRQEPAFTQHLRALRCFYAMLRTPVTLAALLSVVAFVVIAVLTMAMKFRLLEDESQKDDPIVFDDVEKRGNHANEGQKEGDRAVLGQLKGVVTGLRIMGMGEDIVDVELGHEKAWREAYRQHGNEWT